MSVRGRSQVVARERRCPLVSFACITPPYPLPPTACHNPPITSPASWSPVSTYGEIQTSLPPTYAPDAVVAGGSVMQKLIASGGPTPQCPAVPIPQLSRSSFHVGYYVPPTVEPGDPYGGLEQTWNQHFELLFRNLPNVWYFGPIEKTPTGWAVFKDMAKVRFSCQLCSHGWTSMYGLVVFYYRWDAFANQGNIRFILTGQKCNKCERGTFETPMWYPEEAQKVMTNLYHEIANRIYGLQTPPPILGRRHGRPRQQHNSSMCEGCHQGICKTPKN